MASSSGSGCGCAVGVLIILLAGLIALAGVGGGVGYWVCVAVVVMLAYAAAESVNVQPSSGSQRSEQSEPSPPTSSKPKKSRARRYPPRDNDDPDVFYSKIAGVSHYPAAVARLGDGEQIHLVRDRNNPVNSNAVKIVDDRGDQLGFLNNYRADHVGPLMDLGVEFEAVVHELTGTDVRGVNILVRRIRRGDHSG